MEEKKKTKGSKKTTSTMRQECDEIHTPKELNLNMRKSVGVLDFGAI